MPDKRITNALRSSRRKKISRPARGTRQEYYVVPYNDTTLRAISEKRRPDLDKIGVETDKGYREELVWCGKDVVTRLTGDDGLVYEYEIFCQLDDGPVRRYARRLKRRRIPRDFAPDDS